MNDPHHMLKRLLSITADRYDILYAPLSFNLHEWIEKNVPALSSDEKAARVQTIWRYGMDTLKIRRGYLLPFGADAETCYREQQIWNYAVFTAALCYRTASHFHPTDRDWGQAILPRAGLQWLKAHSAIFDDWKAYVQQNDNSTAFYTLERRLKRSKQHLEAKLKSAKVKKPLTTSS